MVNDQIIVDEKYMRRCLQLAANGIQGARPNPMVGAVIVAHRPSAISHQPSIIGEGYHVRCGQGHAEVNAFASVRPEDEPLLQDAKRQSTMASRMINVLFIMFSSLVFTCL